jgi:diamine N-acetyltransferase
MMMALLRELRFDDLPVINRWRSDPELVSLLVAPFRYINIETDRQWFDNYMQNRDCNVRCVICAGDAPDAVIGSIGLLNIDFINRKTDFYIQIGNRSHWGKGIGRDATVQMIHHAFDNLNLNRVQLVVLSTNKRAINLYKKIGFKKEGVLRQSVYKNGDFIDLVLMAIFKDDFVNNDNPQSSESATS